MATLTVFTPAYNRAHTIWRTYESLCRQGNKDFEWLVVDDGSTDNTRELVRSWTEDARDLNENAFEGNCSSGFQIRYIWKENGGLHTGYNTAYANTETELCVCIDSDDWMPDDAVEKILNCWKEKGGDRYAGIMGLDFDTEGQPLGGYFPEGLTETYFLDMYIKGIHKADTKEVMRTDLMKKVAPMEGFEGEKNFNPWYMVMQVLDKYPMLVINDNLCWVEYQIGKDSMSQGIWRQYWNSPKSYAKHRIMSMTLKHNSFVNKTRLCAHYVSSCMIAKDKDWLKNSPLKLLTILMAPVGVVLMLVVYFKNRK